MFLPANRGSRTPRSPTRSLGRELTARVWSRGRQSLAVAARRLLARLRQSVTAALRLRPHRVAVEHDPVRRHAGQPERRRPPPSRHRRRLRPKQAASTMLQTVVPGVEVADLAIAEEEVGIGDHHRVTQPDGALRGVSDGAVALLDIGQREHSPLQLILHSGGASWSFWMCGAHGVVLGRGPRLAGREDIVISDSVVCLGRALGTALLSLGALAKVVDLELPNEERGDVGPRHRPADRVASERSLPLQLSSPAVGRPADCAATVQSGPEPVNRPRSCLEARRGASERHLAISRQKPCPCTWFGHEGRGRLVARPTKRRDAGLLHGGDDGAGALGRQASPAHRV